MRLVAAISMAALAACRPIAHAPTPAPTPTPSTVPDEPLVEPGMPALSALPIPDRIAVTGSGPWGADWHEWLIDRSGAVRMKAVVHEGVRHTRFMLSRPDYLSVRSILGDLERRQGKPLSDLCSTDQGGEAVTWHYGNRRIELMIDGGCSDTAHRAGLAAAAAVGKRLAATAEAAPDRETTLTPQ